MTDLSGQTIRDYQIIRKVGEGGQGVVYLAQHTASGRDVSLKVIRPELARDPDTVRRFQMEAVIAFRLKHPNIVPLVDYWHDERGVFVINRWMPGGSLRDQFLPSGWDAPRTARMLAQLADALTAAHNIDIVHRDLKPDNILFDEQGNAYLTDFGIAKLLKGVSYTGVNVLIGSPAYYTPEQIKGDPVTPQTDIYVLGITLYETLTGEHPYGKASRLMLAQKHVRDPLPPLHEKRPDLPAALDAVLQTATAKTPAERHATPQALKEAFHAAL